VLLAYLFTCIANAQTTSSTNQKFTVSGSVINQATGEPIPRALVTLSASPQRTAFTDNNGSFSLEGVPAGRYALSAQKPGYFGQQERSSHAPQIITAGPGTDPFIIHLPPESVIYGHLTDANGQPIESVGVRLLSRSARNGRMRWEARGYTSTDDEGGFRFPSLQAGKYFISVGPDLARPDAVFTEPQQPQTGWPGLYYPGVSDFASAAPLNLASGQQAQADMTLSRVPLYTISGLVSGYMPGQAVSLQIQNPVGDAVGVATQFNAETGQFEIRLPAGSYRLRAMSAAGEEQLRADIRIAVSKDLTQLHIPLQPAVAIPIHVRMEDSGTPYAVGRPGGRPGSLPVTRYPNEVPPLSVNLIARDPGGADAYSTVTGTAGSRSLVLRGVEPGRYTVELLPHSAWYVDSAQCGNSNLLTEDLLIAAGESCSLEISLRNDAGTLNGSVKSSGPDDGGTALLVSPHGRVAKTISFYSPDHSKSTPIEFSVGGIPPGEYLLYAFDNLESLEYANPEALQPYAAKATPVTISPGQTAKATVELIQTGVDGQ
jgi:protocatechuate 3,4-dioxygenase beta subunit